MASNPKFDPHRGVWRMKYRSEKGGPWISVVLCKHPGWKKNHPVPAKPPQLAKDRHRDFEDIEYRALNGLGAGPKRARSLESYIEGYLESHAAVRRKGSTDHVRRHASRFVEFCRDRGVDTLQGVTRAICRDYLEMRAGAVAASTLKTERGFLMGIWARAVEDELMPSNPWTNARPAVKATDPTWTFWTPEEIGKIVGACRGWWRELVLLLANTGFRVSTGLGMEWRWIDWRAGTIKIQPGEGIKTAYTHVMGRAARDLLERRQIMEKKGSPLVFPNPRGGGVVTYDTANGAIQRAIDRAGVRPGTPHDLRHTYARLLILAGVPVTVVQSQLGHASLAQTQKYVRTTETEAARFVSDFGVGEPPEG
jgi:integrase